MDHGEAVSETYFKIHNSECDLFWCTDFEGFTGWGHRDTADVFSESEKLIYSLPVGGRWVEARLPNQPLTIPAEVYTDDYYEEARFDAAKWFEEATDDEVLELARCGWGGEYASDRVAEWTANLNPSVRAVLDSTGRVRGRKMVGFECHVSEPSAMRWLAKHRPALFQKIYGGNKS